MPTSERGVAIRDAAPADAAAITDVHIRTWQAAYGHVFPRDRLARLDTRRRQRERFWRDTIEGPPAGSHTLVAERSEAIVGFASIGSARDDDAAGEVYAIYVVPEAWGTGAGHALMQESLRRLQQEGYEQAILWVLEDNPRARAFYEREGWSLMEETREETFLDQTVREARYRIAL